MFSAPRAKRYTNVRHSSWQCLPVYSPSPALANALGDQRTQIPPTATRLRPAASTIQQDRTSGCSRRPSKRNQGSLRYCSLLLLLLLPLQKCRRETPKE